MSDLSGVGYLAALIFLGAIFLAILKGIIDLSKNHKKQPKTTISQPILSDKEDQELSREDSEGDGLMGEGDLFFPPENLDDGN
jgi:hypothetical protein